MELFPTKSHANIGNYVETVLRCKAGPVRSERELGTIRARREHYLMFCHSMNLDDDYLLENTTPERRCLQLALYAAHLASGETLVHKTLQADTIRAYLRTAASLIALKTGSDPRKRHPTDKSNCLEITRILEEVERWESSKLDNKREPYTIRMLEHFISTIPTDTKETSRLPCVRDFKKLGCILGNRLSEYAQPSGYSFENPMLGHKNEPKAFTLKDIEFQLNGNKRITLQIAVTTDDHQLSKVRFTYSHQKNGLHGEYRDILRNDTSPMMCGVRTSKQIVKRVYAILGHETPLNTPLAIYLDSTGLVKALSAIDIQDTMRTTAAELYDLNPAKPEDARALQRWSSHSLRVGACVILHTMGFTGPQIKFLLRWSSDAFMMYLRNIALLSQLQNQAITVTHTMPHLF